MAGASRETIALLGLRCSGKSTVGRKLADELGLPFVDLDDETLRAGRYAGWHVGTVGELLERAGMHVVAQAGNAPSLLRAVGEHQPDVAIIDIRMPPTQTTDGIHAALQIRQQFPGGERAPTLEEVKEIQRRLSEHGFKNDVDGRTGSDTVRAIVAFQKKVGMEPDGYAGLKLLARLRQGP